MRNKGRIILAILAIIILAVAGTAFYIWNKPPKSGTYKIYAKTDSGITSPKITVVVP